MLCTTTHTEDFIQDLYLKLNVNDTKDLNYRRIAQLLKISIFYWDEPSQALFLDGHNFIFLDERLSPQQQWQDFCHELCHVLFHNGNQNNLPLSFIQYQEIKANQFMYYAAVPTFMLNKMDLYNCTYENVILIQKLFNVEYNFAVKRLTNYVQRKSNMLYWNTLHNSNLVHMN